MAYLLEAYAHWQIDSESYQSWPLTNSKQGNNGFLPKVTMLNTDMSHQDSASRKDFLLSPQPSARLSAASFQPLFPLWSPSAAQYLSSELTPGQGSLHMVTEQERYVKACTFHPRWDTDGSHSLQSSRPGWLRLCRAGMAVRLLSLSNLPPSPSFHGVDP